MASIATPLLQRRDDADEERLLKLFWNRAELKKELAQLRRDKERLRDQLRQQEGATLRVQQRLEQLENLLVDPLQASNALVYYQLRGVWQQCRRRLARLAHELKERQMDREDAAARERFETHRAAELSRIDANLRALQGQAKAMAADVDALRQQAQALRGFWNYLRRRTLLERAEAANAAVDGLSSQIERLHSQRRDIETEPVPALASISVASRRNINLALIAMAEQLLVQLAAHDVAGRAREAAGRALTDISYGSVAECQVLGRTIDNVVRGLDAPERLNRLVQRRSGYLNRNARYRCDDDAVPVASSLAAIPVEITQAGEARPADARVIPVNVLADDYWDIHAVLLN
ncbi:MAG: hypothetical protein L6Q83_13330 [Gammaproteobacteria bacterium]|nr:hypothetical protein [Gammaproteobacteria bacterium]